MEQFGLAIDVFFSEAFHRIGVDFRNDQRNVLIVAPGRRVIDNDATLRTDLRRPLLRYIATGRHQADIGIGEIVILEIGNLQRAVAIGHFRALAACGSQRNNFIRRETTFRQDVQHFAPDIAGGACDCNFEPMIKLYLSASPLFW